jgi:hypothetical protein
VINYYIAKYTIGQIWGEESLHNQPRGRLARAHALPDAAGRGFRMRACRLVVYSIFFLLLD